MVVSMLNKRLHYIFIPIILIFTFLIAYLFRSYDNTVLFSWNNLFRYVELRRIIIGLIASSIVAFSLSRINLDLSNHHKILLILGASIIFSIPFWIVPEINPDARRFLTQAKYLEAYGFFSFIKDWGGKLFAHSDQPTPSLFFGFLFKFFGEERFIIQTFNTFLFGAGAIATFYIGTKFWNASVGLYSSLFLITSPHLLAQVPLMIIDPFAMSTLAIAIVGFLLAMKDFKIHWILLAFAFSVITLTSKLTIPIVFFSTIASLTIFYASRRHERLRILLLLVMILIPLIILLIFKFDLYLSQFIFAAKASPLTAIRPPRNPVSPLFLFYQLTPPVIILFLLSPFLALYHRDKRFLILLAWIIPLVLTAGWTRGRYLMPIYPAIALGAGYTIEKIIKDRKIRRYAVGCIMLFSLTVALSYIPFMQNFSERNLMDAASYAEQIGFKELTVTNYFPHRQSASYTLIPMFDYYYRGKLKYESDIENIVNYKELPEGFVIISDRRIIELDDNLKNFLLLNYKLMKSFESGTIGTWYPCITSVLKNEGFFISNFNSAESYIIDEDEQVRAISKTMVRLTTYVHKEEKFSAILLHPPNKGGSYLRYSNLHLPFNASLNGGIALDPKIWDPKKGDGVTFKILVQLDNKTTAYSFYIDPKKNINERKVNHFSIDLSQFEDKTISIVFVTEAGDSSTCDWALWVEPRIIMEE